MLQDDILIS